MKETKKQKEAAEKAGRPVKVLVEGSWRQIDWSSGEPIITINNEKIKL